jgi:predicted nucleic-acid-binding protein
MIAVDTHVLLRRLLNDDPVQSERARKLFAGHALILITDVVLVEAIWTLKGKRYKASHTDIERMVMSLLEESNVVFESQQVIWSALNEFINAPTIDTPDGPGSADFPDALIIQKTAMLCAMWGEPFDACYTFDRAAQRLTGARAA